MKTTARCTRVLLMATGAAAAADLARAQPAETGPTAVAELVVTGSRLPQTEVTANSPVAVIGGDRIRDSGAHTLESALNRLPQVSPSFSSAANNPSANGAAFLDLRGLGERRNLVLLDGRRVVGANASNNVDLNVIPNALIERVEIVTGGASAVYGADAVAGVVNVILRRRVDGVEASGRTLVSDRGDGREHELDLAAGRSFDRFSVSGALGWSQRREIGKGARPFSAEASSPSTFLPSGAYVPATTNLPTQAAVNAVFAGYGVAPGAVSNRGGFAGFSFNPDGSLFGTGVLGVPAFDVQNYRGPSAEVVGRFFPDVFAYNFEPFNKLILPLERRSAAVLADVQASERVRLYGQALGVRYTASTALAPTPAPTAPNPLYPGLNVVGFTIPVTNPFIPADLARLLASRTGNVPALAGAGAGEEFIYRFRTVALGPRQSDNRAEILNVVVGAEADLGAWTLEAYASYGRYDRRELQSGLLSVRRFEQLLDSPSGGRDFCDGGFNPFGAQITAGCRDFLEVSARFDTEVEQENAVATITGRLFDAPGGPVQAVAGLERRVVRFDFDPPRDLTPGDVSGFTPLSAVGGSVRFHELFAEAAIPLIRDAALARSVDLTLGYRYSDERTTGGVNAYKAELGWAPVEALRVRASYQRAVRAPDVFERFEPPAGFFAEASDPCAANSPARTPQVLDLCRRQAIALGFMASAADNLQQLSPEAPTSRRGNPDLEPETSDSFTLGAVWRPALGAGWLQDLRLTVDGYDIRVKGAIAYLDPQTVLNACYNVGGGNPGFDPANAACQGFQRSSVDFGIAAVVTPRTNQAYLRTRGIDAMAALRADVAELTGGALAGALDARVAVTRLIDFEEQISALRARIDYAGTIAGSGFGYQSLPRWKALAEATWSLGPARLGVTGRYIGPMEHRLRRENSASLATGAGAATYWDLTFGYELRRDVELRGGVINLFDRQPEIFNPPVDANTDPSTYDVVGRRFWVGLTVRL
jgi:iron complex outermembrane recepter protein